MKNLFCRLKTLTSKFSFFSSASAFALPSLVISATVLMIVAVSLAQTTVSISRSDNSQNWQNLADEAAKAGAAYANSCLKKNDAKWANSLKPDTSCRGISNDSNPYIKEQAASGDSPHWRSSFTVSRPDSDSRAVATGKVELVDSSGDVTKTWVSDRVVVVNVAGDAQFTSTQMSAAGAFHHTCGIANGKAYCWGFNGDGEIGDNTTTNRSVPKAVIDSGVLNGKSVTAISAGLYNTCAIANGSAYCWGRNDAGALGNATFTNSNVPVAVTASGVLSGKTVTAISGAYQHYCAVANGAAYCWGWNDSGELGNNTGGYGIESNVPVAVYASGVLSGKTVTQITGGTHFSCALANGAVYCWGAGGNLGNGTSTQSNVPVAVTTSGVLSGKVVTQISGGNLHTCALAAGKVYCWGANNLGQFGNGTTTASTVPVAVTTSGVLSGKTVTSISVGAGYTCAIADGKAYCWGYNTYGQLGDGTTTQRNTPVAVSTSGLLNGKTITSIIAGAGQTCVTADNGKAYCWGYNVYGQLGNNSTTNSLVPIAVLPAA